MDELVAPNRLPAGVWLMDLRLESVPEAEASPPPNWFACNEGAIALIPVHTKAQPWKAGGARNEFLQTAKCLERTIWEKWSGHDRRGYLL